MRLSFPFARTTATAQIERVDVYRLIARADSPPGITEVDYASRATLIASIPGKDIPVGRASITYDDSVELPAKGDAQRYLYAMRIVDRAGRSGDLSNYAAIVPF